MRDRNDSYLMPIEYFNWLADIVDLRSHNEYSELLLYLFRTEFFWVVPKDIIMAKNGIHLRYDFLEKNYIDVGDAWLDDPCSVLEMLVAMAQRVRFDIMPDFDYEVDYWFWKFLDNLEVLKYDNRHYSEIEVDFIVQKFLKREYFTGGKFCMFFTKKHQIGVLKRTELWYQMHFWLDENYDL